MGRSPSELCAHAFGTPNAMMLATKIPTVATRDRELHAPDRYRRSPLEDTSNLRTLTSLALIRRAIRAMEGTYEKSSRSPGLKTADGPKCLASSLSLVCTPKTSQFHRGSISISFRIYLPLRHPWYLPRRVEHFSLKSETRLLSHSLASRSDVSPRMRRLTHAAH